MNRNYEMKQVDSWLQANGLVINQEKTHYMVFHILWASKKDFCHLERSIVIMWYWLQCCSVVTL